VPPPVFVATSVTPAGASDKSGHDSCRTQGPRWAVFRMSYHQVRKEHCSAVGTEDLAPASTQGGILFSMHG
jgi:hypothetical protein